MLCRVRLGFPKGHRRRWITSMMSLVTSSLNLLIRLIVYFSDEAPMRKKIRVESLAEETVTVFKVEKFPVPSSNEVTFISLPHGVVVGLIGEGGETTSSGRMVMDQIGAGQKKEKHLTKPEVGHFRAQGTPVKRKLKEFPVTEDALLPFGTLITVWHLSLPSMWILLGVKYVNITGITQDKGFQGVMKRHGFSGGPASHGASLSHGSEGSTGERDAPGKVFDEQAEFTK